MKELKAVAKRYAKATCDSIKNKEDYSLVKKGLESFLTLEREVELFKNGMETLLFTDEQKAELLNIIKENSKQDLRVINLLTLLVDRGRLSLLEDIVEALGLEWDKRNKVEKLKVVSVIPLSISQKEKLTKTLSDSFNKEIILEEEIDKTLIAGIKLVRGTINYDFSLSANLNKLRESFTEEM